jgi:hypothetical protein
MPEENDETTTSETEAKPTITIAEKEGGAATATAEAKPTITIAEKDGGK